MQAQTLTDAEYQRLSADALARIEVAIDRWLQDDVIDIDGQRTGGLLELSLPGGSKIVVNTQPPLHELWLATRGGGYHFRYVDGQWRDTRDGVEFFARLSEAASAQAGKPLAF
ncbi:MAG: iron donor protein CyaY [Burkholderiaceae bacterium]|nr:iron donor protein CyaY [Burkholderiaceae bacterium]